LGGREEGILGVTVFNQITLISDWNYYLGDDPLAIGAGQFDFETVVMHELGHALGVGHSRDEPSAMYPYLASGTAKRTLTADDLTDLGESDPESTPEALIAQTLPAHSGDNGVSGSDDDPRDLLAARLLPVIWPEVALSAVDASLRAWLKPGNDRPPIAAPARTSSTHSDKVTHSLGPDRCDVLDEREVDEIWHEVGVDADCSWLLMDPRDATLRPNLNQKSPKETVARDHRTSNN
jgi:hypothetical protein